MIPIDQVDMICIRYSFLVLLDYMSSVSRMNWTLRIHYGLCGIGIALALYSIYVEMMITGFPGYSPACDINSWNFSCSRVFASSYSKILSHFKVVESGHAFDLSLPHFALFYFGLLTAFPSLPAILQFPIRFISIAAVASNVYLGYVLKYELKEFCVICVSTYIVNFALFVTLRLILQSSSLRNIRKPE